MYPNMSVIWWALCKVGIEVYENGRSRACVGCNQREELSVKVSVHQGS